MMISFRKKPHLYRESHWRSMSKALTWRGIATVTTFFITYLVILKNEKATIPDNVLDHATREILRQAAKAKAINKAFYFAGSVAVIDLVVKFFLYYLHERIWQSVNAGWIRRYNRNRKIKKIRKRRLQSEIRQECE